MVVPEKRPRHLFRKSMVIGVWVMVTYGISQTMIPMSPPGQLGAFIWMSGLGGVGLWFAMAQRKLKKAELSAEKHFERLARGEYGHDEHGGKEQQTNSMVESPRRDFGLKDKVIESGKVKVVIEGIADSKIMQVFDNLEVTGVQFEKLPQKIPDLAKVEKVT